VEVPHEGARVPRRESAIVDGRTDPTITDPRDAIIRVDAVTIYEVVCSTARCGRDTVAVVGVGPIGLAAIITARLFSHGRT
jgi:alcohol dehydrogenase